MSEIVLPLSQEPTASQNSVTQMSAGAMLQEAREAQGLHIGALAVLLKVSVKKLEALEADRFELLPDTVFVRALACSVCRTLKINPDPILARLPRTTAPYLKTNETGINVPFRAFAVGSGGSFLSQFSKPFVWAVLLLLVGVVVLVVVPFEPGTEVASVQKTPPSGVLVPLPTVSENSGTGAPLPSTPVTALPVTVPGSGATTGMVIFKARGLSWVEVVDATGVVQVRRTMADGEIVGASGVAPLSVVVGRADATEVQVRGKPLDLTGIAKDNVARFEVK